MKISEKSSDMSPVMLLHTMERIMNKEHMHIHLDI